LCCLCVLLQNTDALIYVVDSSDAERLEESKEELFRLLSEDELRNASVLILVRFACVFAFSGCLLPQSF
jgi:hypothetical protein